MRDLKDVIHSTLAGGKPMSVRQLYYRLVTMRAIDKTELAYKSVVRLSSDMRIKRLIPFNWIVDHSRRARRPTAHNCIEDALAASVENYRRQLWNEQDAYVEIWLEKDALVGVAHDVTSKWLVPLMSTKGYPSLSFTWGAAEAILRINKPTYLYYFGDFDPSGLDIPRVVEANIRKFAPKAEIHFERMAVTPGQIAEWDLPTRPTKKSDSRADKFGSESVELDAIDPNRLRELIERCIVQHIDQRQLEVTRLIEEEEREVGAKLAGESPYDLRTIADMVDSAYEHHQEECERQYKEEEEAYRRREEGL